IDVKKAEDPKKEIDEAEKAAEKIPELPVGAVRRLKNIKANASDNTVEIIVSADGPVRDYKNFFLLKESPPKLVVDIKGKWKYGGKYTMDVNSDLISKIRVAEHNEKEFFRIVMDLKVREGMTPVFNEDAKGLVIIVKK
ncbi:MAG: AMIN domain-containing protein, partial [Desulfobacteraceae bacterium]|nr:AMIN domain-containing protein [Desulfobacteraceae bacterium]